MMIGSIQPGVEKFSIDELAGLREELRRSRLDNWQLGEVITRYLIDHGYGASSHEVREMVARIERTGYSLAKMQEEFEKVARVM